MLEPEFRKAVAANRDLVFRVAYTYLRDAADADDVAQDVFVKLLRRDEPFDGEDHLKNWLIRVTINECKSLFRRPWRRVEDIASYVDSLQVPDAESRNLLVEVMRLPEKYRVPIVLFYYLELPTQQLADYLHVPAATIRTRLARGRSRLRKLLEGEDYE